jgi:hypothetical protein
MMRETKMAELVQHEHVPEDGTEDENLILLLLSPDLRDRYMKNLVNRLTNIDVVVAIEETSYPEEKKDKYDWILNFPGDIPKGKTPDSKSIKLIFRVLGKPELQQDKLDSKDSDKLAKIVKRYKEVQQSCLEREKNPNFVKLALTDAVLRRRGEMILKYKGLVSSLDEEITKVEKSYYLGIGYILSTAIEKITGVAVLDNLMKGLIYVMIIDDLNKRTQDGLVDMDFNRKVLAYMSTSDFSNKLLEFRKEHADDEFAKANISDFIFNAEDFEKVDIVFFNSWKFTEDSFPVRVALRKKTIISKEEERKIDRKEETPARIEKEEKKLAKVKAKYKNVMREISKMEKFHVDDESAYETHNNLRRRLLKDIKSRELHLKDLKRPVKAGGEEKIITFDLFEIFKSKQSFMERMADKASSLGFGSLLGMNHDEKRTSFEKLIQMARYSKDRIKASTQLNKITSQTTKLAGQLDHFVEKNKLTETVESPAPAGTVKYQPLLDDHILDCLELAALGCEISYLSEGQGEQV